jgi:hypothetical protein
MYFVYLRNRRRYFIEFSKIMTSLKLSTVMNLNGIFIGFVINKHSIVQNLKILAFNWTFLFELYWL